jgi:hypothetical protein
MELPSSHGISELAWNKARHALSEGFTTPIEDRLEEVTSLAKSIDALESYDYKFLAWKDFEVAEKPEGLYERAVNWKGEHSEDGLFVIFDPLDDEQGFLLLGADPVEIAKMACEYISDMFPEEGPLSVDSAAKNVVENT